jgi:uncharacterized membrane protein YjgN (DUF898 family)
VNPTELILSCVLVMVLIGLAVLFAWRQKRTLLYLKHETSLSSEDRSYLKGQVRRRLLCSLFMVIFAGFLVGWFFLEEDFRQLRPALEKAAEAGPLENDPSKDSLRFYTAYWIGALLVLLGIMLLAGMDLIATLRFGFRHQRQLLSEHRTVLESEAAQLRYRRQELN